MTITQHDISSIERQVEAASKPFRQLVEQMHRVIVGQDELLEGLLIGLLSNGHILIEGVPGLAKTTAVATLAAGIRTGFQRVQFTPDLLPADLIGTLIYRPGSGDFVVKKGPIFTNIVLADEINRAPAKVQSALLEAMQERQVTIDGVTTPLPSPFLVMATQNPVEMEGTFPLPEAQLDRFMVRIVMGYPNAKEEGDIYLRFERDAVLPSLKSVTSSQELINLMKIPPMVRVDESVRKYIVSLILATREHQGFSLGASPRAGLSLYKSSQAWAAINGRDYVTPDDVKKLSHSVLPHRMILSSTSRLRGSSAEQLVKDVLGSVPVPIER